MPLTIMATLTVVAQIPLNGRNPNVKVTYSQTIVIIHSVIRINDPLSELAALSLK